MINRVVLVGRLTRDPELRKTNSGASVVSFTVACDRRFKTQGQPDADFISCVAWNKVADLMAQYLREGSLRSGVEGRIQTRNYDDANGRRVYVTEVVAESVQFLEPKQRIGEPRSAALWTAFLSVCAGICFRSAELRKPCRRLSGGCQHEFLRQ